MIDLTAHDRPANHRGRYILECGIWRATCEDCGWSVQGATRRRAATMFRMHIQSMRPPGTAASDSERDRAMPDLATGPVDALAAGQELSAATRAARRSAPAV